PGAGARRDASGPQHRRVLCRGSGRAAHPAVAPHAHLAPVRRPGRLTPWAPGSLVRFFPKPVRTNRTMTLTDQLTDYVRAAFSGLYLLTHEPDEAEREIATLARSQDWKLACWDVAGGLRFPGSPPNAVSDVGAGDPLAVLRAVPALAQTDGTAL